MMTMIHNSTKLQSNSPIYNVINVYFCPIKFALPYSQLSLVININVVSFAPQQLWIILYAFLYLSFSPSSRLDVHKKAISSILLKNKLTVVA